MAFIHHYTFTCLFNENQHNYEFNLYKCSSTKSNISFKDLFVTWISSSPCFNSSQRQKFILRLSHFVYVSCLGKLWWKRWFWPANGMCHHPFSNQKTQQMSYQITVATLSRLTVFYCKSLAVLETTGNSTHTHNSPLSHVLP